MNRVVPPTVRLSGVRRTYHAGAPEEVRALAGVDLTVTPGEFLSVEGPSGCGKTTLLNLLGLIDQPTAGTLTWDGTPVAARSEGERARLRLASIGFIFQRFYLVPTMTARENVELPLRAARRPAAERKARAAALLKEVGLTHRAGAFPHQLSGGEEQRVAVARAMANGPGLILADEPTGELDRANTTAVLDLIDRLHRESGVSVVLVTHNPLVAARAARHLTMEDGRIVGDTTGPVAA